MASLPKVRKRPDVTWCGKCDTNPCKKDPTLMPNPIFCAYFKCLNNYQPNEDCDITTETLDKWEKEWLKTNKEKNFWTQQGYVKEQNCYISFETLARWKYSKYQKERNKTNYPNVKKCLDHIVDKIYGDMKDEKLRNQYVKHSKTEYTVNNYVNHLILRLKETKYDRIQLKKDIKSYMENKEFITRAIGADAFSKDEEEVFMTWLTKDFYFSNANKKLGVDIVSRQPTNILCFMMTCTYVRHIYWEKLKDANGIYNPDYNFRYNPTRKNAIQILCSRFFSRTINTDLKMLEEWVSQKHINSKRNPIPIHGDSLDPLINVQNTLGENGQPQALWMISEFWTQQEKLNPKLKRIQMSDRLYDDLKNWINIYLKEMKKEERNEYMEGGAATFLGQTKKNRKDMLEAFLGNLKGRIDTKKLKELKNMMPTSLYSLNSAIKTSMSWRPYLQLKF